MDRRSNKHGVYEFVQLEQLESSLLPNRCKNRSDDSTFGDGLKAWCLFLIHMIASVLLVVGIIEIDGLQFKIGSGPTIFSFTSSLYQAQVTGLVSLALVILRLIAGSCSGLLAWRIIFILLEKRGISLAELTRLTNWRIPVLPGTKSESSVLWSTWAMVTVLLLWPQGFAAPLASSSLSWIPGTTILKDPTAAPVARMARHADWASILYEDMRSTSVVAAAAMTAKDPAYAFHSSQLPLRRYFNTTQSIPTGSKMDITVPYFTVNLRWVDATSDNKSENAGDPKYTDVNNRFGIRIVGTTAIVRDEPWDGQKATPSGPGIFTDKRLVSVKLRTLNYGDELPDGSRASNQTKCLTSSGDFGKLPDVEQRQMSFVNDVETVAVDCYIFAEATITAGAYSGKDCIVSSSNLTSEKYATCSIDRNDDRVEQDWLANISIDFMSEALKYTVMQNYSQPWISGDLDDYTSGMLMLGYHAAWSGLMKQLGKDAEQATVWPSEAVVLVSVDRTKLYIWLGMNATLTVSAVLVFAAQRVSRTKTVRDTAVAALTVDLTEVSHRGRTRGLCNAVELNKADGKLPKLRWKESEARDWNGRDSMGVSCQRTVVFAEEARSVRRVSYEYSGNMYGY